jgi:transcriptional regulator with XRE-family HTH domain
VDTTDHSLPTANAVATLAACLRAERVACGLAQIDLAMRADVSLSSVVHIERGLNTAPLWPTILKLAEVLDVDPRWLLWGDGDTPSEP